MTPDPSQQNVHSTASSPGGVQPRRALRAIRALMNDPSDLPQVFAIIESLSGPAPGLLAHRFRRSSAGARLLHERPDITLLLEDREGLRSLPEGSLGRAYLAFVESENISAEGIRAASENRAVAPSDGNSAVAPADEQAFVKVRMRDTHDLWHALTGYKGDIIGEAALLGFIFAQT